MRKFAPNTPKLQSRICGICNEQVELETSKVDEAGRTIHDQCYLLKLRLREATTLPKAKDGASATLPERNGLSEADSSAPFAPRSAVHAAAVAIVTHARF